MSVQHLMRRGKLTDSMISKAVLAPIALGYEPPRALVEHLGLQAEMPRLQDMFQGFLRELRPEDLAGSAGNFQLRAEILRRVNLVAAPGKVDAVLIEEMLVR